MGHPRTNRYLRITPAQPIASFPSVVTVTVAVNNGIETVYELFDVTIEAVADVEVVRLLPDAYLPNIPVTVGLDVIPGAGVTTYTIVEYLPTGWVPSNISDSGVYNAGSETITFSGLTGSVPHSISYDLTPVPGASGSYPMSGTVTSNLGTEPVFGNSVLNEPVNQTYDDWKAAMLGGAQNDPNTGINEDYNNDGISNLISYSMDVHPSENIATKMPISALEDIAGNNYLTITFLQSQLTPGLIYTVLDSVDLQSWSSNNVDLSIIGTDGNAWIMKARDQTPLSAVKPKIFMRLKVEEP